ncbi:MAG TPA: hypothetical protein VFW11_20135 [Cyclobacteriaceae bacterium]|nr:hypothetical protein [Cyclobacteriaceae bacterium]
MKIFRKSLTIFFLLSTGCASLTWAQSSGSFSSFLSPDCAWLQKRNNELAYSGSPQGNFYCNPLVLDGVAFDYNSFTLESKGELKLTKGDAKTGKVVDIPFYLHLRRNGMLITHPCGDGVIFSKIEISAILKAAKDGDELIIEPVNKKDWPAKRIVRIGDKC